MVGLVAGGGAAGRRIPFGLGWLANLALWAFNWVVAGEPPFGNMYHVQVFLGLCFLPLGGWLARRAAMGWAAPYFAFASALPLVGALFMDQDVTWRRMPALQSPWFVPHVTAYMIAYALATVAFVLLLARLIRSRRPDFDPAAHRRAATETLRLAFPFMTFGMLSGALWAEEAWGVYWSWDPKETWSLVTWTLYLAHLHGLGDERLRKVADWTHALAFLALLTTFFLVNLLPKLASVLHSYA